MDSENIHSNSICLFSPLNLTTDDKMCRRGDLVNVFRKWEGTYYIDPMGNYLLYFDKTHVWAARRSRDSHSLYQGGQGRPCSHSISYSQIVSLPVSIFSDAYFIQRDEDNTDPDPELKMAMRIFPWMLIVVIHSITVWTCIAALLGEYVIPCICVYFSCKNPTGLGFLIFANLLALYYISMLSGLGNIA